MKGWPAPVVGFTLTTLAVVTASRWPKVNAVVMYLLWLAFTIALGSNVTAHPISETPLVIGLVAAMMLHLKRVFVKRSTASAARA